MLKITYIYEIENLHIHVVDTGEVDEATTFN